MSQLPAAENRGGFSQGSGAGRAPAQRTVKSAPPAALPESKGKALTLPKAGERGFLAGGVSVEGSPFLYGSERAAAALLGAGEGVTDFIGSGFYKGVQGISSLGGLAPNPVSEWAGRNADAFLENSVTRDYEESIRERYRPSQGAENVTGIGQAIVQMLPGIGASKAVSAAGKGLNAAQAISRGENVGRALFGLQAAGNAASQAKAEGATSGQALAFGAASGALETAIEGIAGGIPGLGGGKVEQIAEAVKASPLVSRALGIAGEGGEEALSTALTPYLQRAIYDPDAPNATLGEIGQSALMGAVAAGVLQGGLELPGAISNAASDIRTTRRAIGSNEDIARRATANIQAGQNMARYSSGNPLAVTLPTVEEAKSGLFLPGSPVYQRNAVDNPSGAGYDGGNQTETGGVTYERGKETSASLEGVHGASLQAETPGSEETYRGRMGGVLEEGRRVQQPEAWAQGHIIRTPSAQAQNAASRAKQYSSDVFIVDDAALKARNPNAWAVTNGGKIYISDAVPAELADAVGYHECVHVLRQQDNEAYHGFLSDESHLLNRSSETAMDLLDLVVDARFPGKSIMDLTPEEAAIAYDELNALVWGYYKADPENARAQFSGAFQDYDAYIQELDAIMEGARQTAENQTGVGPAQAQGPESPAGAPAYRDVADNPLTTMLPTGEEALAGKRAYLPGSREYRGTASEGTKKTAPTEEAVNENGLTSLTERERINLSSGKKNKIVSTFKDAVSFVKNALINKQNTDRAYLGRVPDPVAQKIHEDTGLDLKGFGVMMNGDDVRHIMKNHGDAATERSRGQIAITPNDIARIPEILASPDRIYTSEEMDGKGRTAIIFEKQMGDYYITIQGISDGKQLLQTDTLYKRRTRTTRDTMLETQEGLAPVINAQGEPPQSSSNISILPGGQDVNLQQGDRGETQDTPREGPGPAFETGPESSVGAARKGFDPWSEFQGTRSEFFPEGANAARPVDVPTTDPQGRRIRKTASTAMGAKAIPDEVVGDIQNMVLRGELSYDRRSDRASTDRAVRTIEEKGYQRALEEFSAQVRKGVVSKDIATLGQQLLINAANAGDGKATAELLSLYAQMETTAGQAVQAASILRKLAPSEQLYAAKRVVSELEKTIQKNYKDLEITIDPSLIEEFNQQTDQAGRDEVLDKIYQNVADQVPAKWKDKWNAWRYMAMLFNPRTHIRNIVGNVGFQPLRWTKDRVAATIEAGVSKVSGGRLGRTKSFAANPALYKAAWADWANVQDVLSGNKYDDIRTEINSRRRIFRTAPLEAGRKINSWALEAEDAIFKRITYADALAGYLQSNGVTAEQMRNNTVDTQLLSRARDYAGREALKATYQDRNMVSDKVVQIARTLGPAGEAVLPFKRTPANILVRGMEYSPAGLAKALTYDLIQVKRGRMTGAEAIDHIASGLTGSGLMALGAYLFAQGIVTSGGGDDEGQDAINDLTGVQNYALNLPGGGNVTLDWLAPEALPFFMGVELMDSMGQGGNTAESISTALKSISDPMLELSMLQSLNDVIDSVSFSENKLGALVSSALVSYFTQPIPTFGGQIERSAEDVRMTTYTDKNLRLPTDLQYAIGRASARIPGWDYQQMPYIDAWGREDSSGPLWLRMANNFLNPAYTSNKQVTPVDEEIQRIYDQTGDASVVPQRPERYITVDGERIDLSKEKYEQYATKRGQMQFEMLGNIIDNPTYRSMSDTDKAFVIDSVYEYADKTTKSEISSYRLDGWVKTAAHSDLSPEDYILFRAAITDIEGEDRKDRIMSVIDRMNVSDEVKDDYYYAAGYKESTIDDAPWHSRW
ncbi:MAG: hypothetical protein MR952_12670 [Flavonifractor plautii]|nr:hypothetical protein [Flavonifractor plautii]MDY3700853.1 hypothetical protein [Flavonifractor plautii]